MSCAPIQMDRDLARLHLQRNPIILLPPIEGDDIVLWREWLASTLWIEWCNGEPFLSDQVKKQIHAIICLVFTTQDFGFSFERKMFDYDNIVLKDGELKFRQLFVQESDENSISRDFLMVRELLLQLLFDGDEECRDLIQYNFALMGVRGQKGFLIYAWEQHKLFTQADWIQFVAAAKQLPNALTWTEDIQGFSELTDVYAANNTSTDDTSTDDEWLLIRFFHDCMNHLLDRCILRAADDGRRTQLIGEGRVLNYHHKYDDCVKLVGSALGDSVAYSKEWRLPSTSIDIERCGTFGCVVVACIDRRLVISNLAARGNQMKKLTMAFFFSWASLLSGLSDTA